MATSSIMHAKKGGLSRIAVSLFLFMMLVPGLALAGAGKIIFIIGNAEIISEDFSSEKARRGMLLEVGDTIKTSAKGQVQVKMTDGGLVAVRPNSEFKIEEFQYDGDVDTDKNFYSLLKGGFRSVTGAIGEANKSAYKVDTPVATIGIRGTDYSARLCDADCDADNGLYIGVMSGGVTLTNDSGSVDIDASEYGFVSDVDAEPVLLDAAPGEVLFAQSETQTTVAKSTSDDDSTTTASSNEDVVVAVKASNDSGQTLNFNDVSSDTVVVASTSTESTEAVVEESSTAETVAVNDIDETINVEETVVAETTTPDPVFYKHVTMVGHDKSPIVSKELTESVIYATGGDLDTFKITNTSGSVFDYSRDTAISAVDTGSTTNNEVSWGRWVDMNLNVTDNSGTNSVGVTNANSVHWAITNEFEEVVLPSSGTYLYQVVGGTTPVDNYGGSGLLSTDSTLSVDFANQSANFSVRIDNIADPADGTTYGWVAMYNTMPIDPATGEFRGDITSFVPANGVTNHLGASANDPVSGSASGSFAGFRSNDAPTAAVIGYEANRTYENWTDGSSIDYQIRGVAAAELQP